MSSVDALTATMTSDIPTKISSLEDIFSLVGFGKWNFLYFMVACLNTAVIPINLIGSKFTAPPANFTCADPVGPSADLETDSQCRVLVYSVNESVEAVDCRSFHYDRSTFEETVTMQFDMVCSHDWQRKVFQLALTVGCLFGSPMGGLLSSRWGRQPTVWMGSLLMMAGTVVVVLAPSTWLLMVARFTIGFAGFVIHVAAFTIGLEACPLEHRSTYGMVSGLPYALMGSGVAIIAYFWRHWKGIQLLGSIPLLLLILLSNPWVLHESPRWLMSCGRVDEAQRVLIRAARLNGTQHRLPHNFGTLLIGIQEKQELSTPIVRSSLASRLRTLVCTPEMRRITFCSMALMLIHGTLFLSLPLRADVFRSPFLYVALLGLGEAPAYTITAPIINKMGRKAFIITAFILTSALEGTLALLTAMRVENSVLLISLSVVAYCIVTSGYQGNNVYCSELFPTTVRSFGFALASLMCTAGYNVPPILDVFTPAKLPWLPLVVYTCLGPLGILLILLLPETNRKPLQQTVTETSPLKRWSLSTTKIENQDQLLKSSP